MDWLWRAVGLLCLAGSFWFGWKAYGLTRTMRKIQPGFTPFEFRLRYSRVDFAVEMCETPQSLRDRYFVMELLMFYCLLLLLPVLLVAGHNAARWPWQEWTMHALACAFCVSGVVENRKLLMKKNMVPASRVKWIALFAWSLCLFGGLVAYAARL